MVGPFLGPAIAGYIGAGTNWRDSFGVLTALYGLSTLMVLAFGRETYYVPDKPASFRLGEYFGIGNTGLPKRSTLGYWCRTVAVYVFKFPLLMTGFAILVTFTWPIGKLSFLMETFQAPLADPCRHHNHHRCFPA